MGFDVGRRRAAAVHAGQLLHMVYLLLTSERLGYRQWVMVRLINIHNFKRIISTEWGFQLGKLYILAIW